jgi:hypothetical protein
MADQVTTGWFVGRTRELARLHQLLGSIAGFTHTPGTSTG